MTEINILYSLLAQGANAALRAGADIMDIYNRNETCEVSIKSDRTPLIEADQAAHIAIKEALGASRIPILSEEGREMKYEERMSWEMFWLVDPLDGTQEFINRTGEFTINIALIERGEVMASVIYAPSLQRLNFAIKGEGSHLCTSIEVDTSANMSYNDLINRAISLPTESTPRTVQRIAITRSHKNQQTFDHINTLIREGYELEIVEQGSSYKFCMLAEGVVDYYIRTSMTYEWDTAAGELILREAGGATISLDDTNSFAYNKQELQNPHFKAHSALSRIR